MAKTRTKFKELLGRIDFSLKSEPTKNTSESITGYNIFDYLVKGLNFTWFKLKDLFATDNDGYLPKIDDSNKKLIKSNINDNGSIPKYGTYSMWHSGNDGSGSGLDADLLDGKHSTEFIIPADFDTNTLYTPTLNPTWTIKDSNGSSTSLTPTGSSITLEYGYQPSATVTAKWTQPSNYNIPERSDGLCGVYTIPSGLAIDTYTSPAASTSYATYFTPTDRTVSYKSVIVWTIYATKRGITVSGNKLIMPTGETSTYASLSVTYQLPIYYGLVTTNSMTEAIIEALTSNMKNCSTSSKSFSPNINASDTQYWVYAYPSAWGTLTNISNADGDWSAAFSNGTLNLTANSTTLLTTEYRYYITVNRGAFKNKIINFS